MKLPTMLLVLLLASAPAIAQTPAVTVPSTPPPVSERPGSQVVVEAGLAVPRGDLAGDFLAEPLGFGADNGLELGFRWRYFLTPSLSISPAFHFTDFGGYEGEDAVLGEYRIESSTYRYTAELMWTTASAEATIRPFLAASAGIFRNRVVGFTKTFEKSFDQSVNTPGFTARAGVALAELEFSLAYHLNRFSTWRYFQTGEDQAYDWDVFIVRGAWVLPFGD